MALAACRPSPGGPETTGPRAPDQIVRRFTMTTYAADRRAWTLTAPEAQVYDGENRTEIDRPHLQFFNDGAPSSTVDAARGTMDTATRDMWAGGGVVIVSTQGARLESDWVRFDAAGDLLASTAPVTITRGQSTVQGVGWSARPDFSEMEVLNQRGEIAPEDERFFRHP